ncbi:uncharacterized protein LOC110650508 [Hevea brasiliensis]|uniref:uncharacterized protein LOC110650508 n=1 Tax=Hevea brasiliensis TaxID=3981 RepID=UPI0025CCE0C2|nr:uncharacterized protein LOC110650508 [Hevea brasiliensis]
MQVGEIFVVGFWEMQMQILLLKPPCFAEFLSRQWLKPLSLLAFCSSSDYLNQSRDSLPRFFSEVLPSSKTSQREVDMMMEAGGTAVGLGPLHLCVETATMALLAALMLWSDAQQFSNAYIHLQVRFVKYFASYTAPSICQIQMYTKEMAYKN